MCLIVTAAAPERERANLERAAGTSPSAGLRVDVQRPSRWPWRRNPVVRATISEDGGCACGLLDDDADWNAPTWRLRQDVVERLAATIRMLAHDVPGLSIEALWAGDRPTETVRLSGEDLAAVIRRNAVGTRTTYQVVR